MWIDELIIKLNSRVKWRVSQKLTVLIGLLLLSLVITGLSSIYVLNIVNDTFQRTLDINIKRTIIASQMNDDLMRFDRLVVEHIRSRYQADRRKIENDLLLINNHFNLAIHDLKLLKQDSTNNAILNELEPSWVEYDHTVQKILDKSKNNDFEGAMELWDGWASVRYRDIKYLIKEVISYNLQLAQYSKLKANHDLKRSLFLIVSTIILTTIISIVLGIIIVRYLQISLRKLVLVNERVSQGNLSQGLDLALNYNTQDEFAELAESNRKVVNSIKKMVEDVTTLAEKYSPLKESAAVEEPEQPQLTDLINMEKTLVLVQELTKSVEIIKKEIGRVCNSEFVNTDLEEAHHKTLNAIDNFNKGIQKLDKLLINLNTVPERISQLIAKYGYLESLSGRDKLKDALKKLEELPTAIINTMEIIKFSLLDQKMLLDSREIPIDSDNTNKYFNNLAKAIKNIISHAETTGAEAQAIQQALQIINQNIENTQISFTHSETSQDTNEFEILLDKLSSILINFKK